MSTLQSAVPITYLSLDFKKEICRIQGICLYQGMDAWIDRKDIAEKDCTWVVLKKKKNVAPTFLLPINVTGQRRDGKETFLQIQNLLGIINEHEITIWRLSSGL